MRKNTFEVLDRPLRAVDLWENFFDQGADLMNRRLGTSLPAVNIKDKEHSYHIEVAAPGMDKEDFSIQIQQSTLVIACEKKQEQERKKENYTRREFNYYSFKRVFDLPEIVDNQQVHATYKDGILTIDIPKLAKKANTHKVVVH